VLGEDAPDCGFQLAASASLDELQEQVNGKFSCQTQLYWECHPDSSLDRSSLADFEGDPADHDHLVPLESNLDLRRAIQEAALKTFQLGLPKCSLQLWVHKLFSEFFDCCQCQETFKRD
jgi:hypothetical protein